MSREILYLKIAEQLEIQIKNGILKSGDKLPSVRSLRDMYKVGLNTAKQAYLELEGRSLIQSIARSGYYVSQTSQRKLALPSSSMTPKADPALVSDDLISKVFGNLQNKEIRQFSLGVPDKALLPAATLHKSLRKLVRSSALHDESLTYESVQGSLNLRRSVAKWSMLWEGNLNADDIVTSSGAMNAIFNCLMALTKPGDTVAIESPVYFGTIQIIKALGLKAIEIPTHPITGIHLDALKKLLHKIDVCCFVTNFSNPLGFLMPEEHKKELVNMLAKQHIPLIEDDIYGNLSFDGTRPKPCKAFDEEGLVMWCSSVSKTLASGYRVGWVAPGKYKEKVIRQKLLQTIAMPAIHQEVVADFMEHGRYDFHLRTFRSTLQTNFINYQNAILDYFPENSKISRPQGGFMLWVELDKKIDSSLLYDLAIRQKIGFAPGRMFTQHDQYHNCLRLNFALAWNDDLKFDLRRLGNLIKSYK